MNGPAQHSAPVGASPVTSVVTFSDPGDYIGVGQPRFFYPGNSSIKIIGNAGYFTISVSGGSIGTDNFSMVFAAPPSETLHTGLYTGLQRAPFRQSGHAGMDIYGDGRGCNEVGGRFDVKDFHVGGNGIPDRLWISYEQHCETVPAGNQRARRAGQRLVGVRRHRDVGSDPGHPQRKLARHCRVHGGYQRQRRSPGGLRDSLSWVSR